MNTIIEFKLVPNSNQTVLAMGTFSLLESEVNPVLQKIVSYNWTVGNLNPYMVGDTPKLQFLQWSTQGNLTTILSNLKTSLA